MSVFSHTWNVFQQVGYWAVMMGLMLPILKMKYAWLGSAQNLHCCLCHCQHRDD